MPSQKIINLLELLPDPLEVALLEIVKPFPIWIGRYEMGVKVRGRTCPCRLFEPAQAMISDELLVDGERFVYILRNGNKWPARLLAEAVGRDALAHFPTELREGVSRIKPVQNGLSNGYLKIKRVDADVDAMQHKNGPLLTITANESSFWMGQCDLIKSSDHALEWRFRQSVSELRMTGVPEPTQRV
jgi:hypothetical protein